MATTTQPVAAPVPIFRHKVYKRLTESDIDTDIAAAHLNEKLSTDLHLSFYTATAEYYKYLAEVPEETRTGTDIRSLKLDENPVEIAGKIASLNANYTPCMVNFLIYKFKVDFDTNGSQEAKTLRNSIENLHTKLHTKLTQLNDLETKKAELEILEIELKAKKKAPHPIKKEIDRLEAELTIKKGEVETSKKSLDSDKETVGSLKKKLKESEKEYQSEFKKELSNCFNKINEARPRTISSQTFLNGGAQSALANIKSHDAAAFNMTQAFIEDKAAILFATKGTLKQLKKEETRLKQAKTNYAAANRPTNKAKEDEHQTQINNIEKQLKGYTSAIEAYEKLEKALEGELHNPHVLNNLSGTAIKAHKEIDSFRKNNPLKVSADLNKLTQELASYSLQAKKENDPHDQINRALLPELNFNFNASNPAAVFEKLNEDIKALNEDLKKLDRSAAAGMSPATKETHNATELALQEKIKKMARKVHKLNKVAGPLLQFNQEEVYRKEFMAKLRLLADTYQIKLSNDDLGGTPQLALPKKYTEQELKTLQEPVTKIEIKVFTQNRFSHYNHYSGTHQNKTIDMPPITREELLHIMADLATNPEKLAKLGENLGIESLRTEILGNGKVRIHFTTSENTLKAVSNAKLAIAMYLKKEGQQVYDNKTAENSKNENSAGVQLPVTP